MNLLPVLDALLRERHVGRAAKAVGRSQPAVSHALARLRALFGDPLLEQSGRRMVLTARAQSLCEPVSRLMRDASNLIVDRAFDPSISTRTFRLMMPDILASFIMPVLIGKLAVEAPGVRLTIAEWRGEKTLSRDYLDTIDVIVSAWVGRFPGFAHDLLFRDHDVVAVRAGARTTARLHSLQGFLAAQHAAVVGPGERQDLVDVWLKTVGHTRNVAVTVPSYLLALGIVAETDMVAVLPKRLIEQLGARLRVRAVPLPMAVTHDEIFLHYPTIAKSDAGSEWLRAAIRSVTRSPRRAAAK